MIVKQLFVNQYAVVAVIDGDTCPAEEFLLHGEATTESARNGLRRFLEEAATRGLSDIPSAWFHEADKQKGIYEFTKGPLRLFFFKGENGHIAVCTGGVRKDRKKADPPSVARAAKLREKYFEAIKSNQLEVIKDE